MEQSTRWVLTFVGDGKAILSTTQSLELEAYEHVREMWDRWVKSDDQLMVIGDCRVEKVGRVELEIGAEAIIVHGRS